MKAAAPNPDRSVAKPAAFERASYMKVLTSYALRSGAWRRSPS